MPEIILSAMGEPTPEIIARVEKWLGIVVERAPAALRAIKNYPDTTEEERFSLLILILSEGELHRALNGEPSAIDDDAPEEAPEEAPTWPH